VKLNYKNLFKNAVAFFIVLALAATFVHKTDVRQFGADETEILVEVSDVEGNLSFGGFFDFANGYQFFIARSYHNLVFKVLFKSHPRRFIYANEPIYLVLGRWLIHF